MGAKKFGEQTEVFQLQPGWNINTDFTRQILTGSCVFECEVEDGLGGELKLGTKHPKTDKLELISKTVVGLTSGKCHVQCEYFGLLANPTRPIWSFYNSTGEEPIEVHPDFADFAGNKDNPKPGAIFDPASGEFFGFNSEASAELRGVRGFLDGKPVLRKTWFSDKALDGIDTVMKVYNLRDGAIPGLPSGTNALKSNWGSNIVGNFFEIWEEYQLSGENGWSKTIYGDPIN
ncbi:MAG: hypothetical protein NE327_09170 [Lentisphaeraceae bacterium]|nr:hypothetical protein [Lentisphaeraceae bacterium]